MKLAHKYEMESIRRCVSSVLKESWPETFTQWSRLREEQILLKHRHLERAGDNFLLDGKSLDDSLPEPASAIRLAQDFDIHSILPSAYYALASIPVSHDWDEVRSHSAESLHSTTFRTARWSLLRVEDLRRLLRGRETLIQALANIVEEYSSIKRLQELMSPCTEAYSCGQGMPSTIQWWMLAVFDDTVQQAKHPDPIGLMDSLCNSRSNWSLCQNCANALQNHMRLQQETTWGAIPGAFGISRN